MTRRIQKIVEKADRRIDDICKVVDGELCRRFRSEEWNDLRGTMGHFDGLPFYEFQEEGRCHIYVPVDDREDDAYPIKMYHENS